MSVSNDVGCENAFASRLAPTKNRAIPDWKKISTPVSTGSLQKDLQEQPKFRSAELFVPIVAEVVTIVVIYDLVSKSVERAGIFNTSQFTGNIRLSSVSSTRRAGGNVRQTSAKTRHFLLISSPSRPKVRAERPCWKRSIRLKY
ncbi:hypothetical protein ACSFE6_06170 [Pseudomonas baetica]|uniref:hypothetical protein n=1 Tax=Pseudomonas baetica TaxID=674054 RepID=UPI003EE9DA51